MLNDDNSKNRSTVNILDILREEVLPDANLSPDSLVRKKRDTERFNAMLCAAFVQFIKIINLIYAHWKLQIERAIEKFESERQYYRQKIHELKLIVIQKGQLSAQQLAQVESISNGFLNLLNIIGSRIQILNQKIEIHNEKINRLKEERVKLHETLLETWKSQVLTMKMPNIIIPFKLPLQYQSNDKRDEVEQHIYFTGNELSMLMKEVGNELINKESLILEFQNLFYEKMLPYIKEKLEMDWAFLSNYDRESAINLKLKELGIKQQLTEPLLELVSKDPLVNENIKSRYILDQDIAHSEAQRNLEEAYRDVLMDKFTSFESAFKEFEAESKLLKSKSINNEIQSDQNIDKILDEFNQGLKNTDHSLDNDEDIFYRSLADIDIISFDCDDLLDNLDQFSDEIEQNHNSNQLEILEKKQVEIETKVQDLIQSIQKQEESMEVKRFNI